eukprot:NODE_8121_length_708_cov_9.434188_g7502_i0.p1 GENE.NODE_8121_length_708_cov_9.434188_g7502_i0~~NODE_8121_length_708_cov_9.434188_g7502_i0.p1  ORF type:complete len:154 (+),score=36.02 NODE_8121_length_708_cov_9.434188_g7502_i0:59-520(+)
MSQPQDWDIVEISSNERTDSFDVLSLVDSIPEKPTDEELIYLRELVKKQKEEIEELKKTQEKTQEDLSQLRQRHRSVLVNYLTLRREKANDETNMKLMSAKQRLDIIKQIKLEADATEWPILDRGHSPQPTHPTKKMFKSHNHRTNFNAARKR